MLSNYLLKNRLFKYKIVKFSNNNTSMSEEEKYKNTKDLIEKIKNNELNKIKPKEMNILQYDEYKIVLAKSIYNYKKIKLQKSMKKVTLYFILISSSLMILKLFSLYYIFYYLFMWDIDLRNPKVSDYIIERFR